MARKGRRGQGGTGGDSVAGGGAGSRSDALARATARVSRLVARVERDEIGRAHV